MKNKKKHSNKNEKKAPPVRKFYPLPVDTSSLLEKIPPQQRADNFSLLFYRHLAFRGEHCSLSGKDKKFAWDEVRRGFSIGRALRSKLFGALNFRLKSLKNGLKKRGLPVKEVLLVARSPLVVGFGLESVLEAGILLHHIYGVPYIPGSSLKGVLRFWLESFEEEKTSVEKLFGTQNEAGILCFSDFLPESINNLVQDIINCHYQNYYAGKAPPTEAENPVPVYFLTIPAGARFRGILWLKEKSNSEELEAVLQALKEALGEWGIGAKTATGYGRMQVEYAD